MDDNTAQPMVSPVSEPMVAQPVPSTPPMSPMPEPVVPAVPSQELAMPATSISAPEPVVPLQPEALAQQSSDMPNISSMSSLPMSSPTSSSTPTEPVK